MYGSSQIECVELDELKVILSIHVVFKFLLLSIFLSFSLRHDILKYFLSFLNRFSLGPFSLSLFYPFPLVLHFSFPFHGALAAL